MKDLKILVVDDSPFQISVLSDMLKENNFNVIGQAMSLEEAIEEVKKNKPDLVTMDITMPGKDGFECTKEIHKIDRDIKVIVVSSMMDDELIKKAKRSHICGYLQKPIDAEDLTLLIKRVVRDDELYEELKNIYKDVFKEAILDVFNKMTKTVPKIIEHDNIENHIESKGIAVVLGVTGKYAGRVIFDMSDYTAKNFVTELLRREPKSKEEILNVVSEVSNMFAGNTCSMINKKNKIFGLRVAPPTAFHGESVNISEVDIENNFIGTAQTDFGDMTVNIGFNRGENEWMSVL